MDLLKKAKDRATQSIGEAVGTAAKTEVEPETKNALKRFDEMHHELDRLVEALHAYMQPDHSLEEYFGAANDTPNKAETLGKQLMVFGNKLTQMDLQSGGKNLKAGSVAYTAIGTSHKAAATRLNESCLVKYKDMLKDVKVIEHDRAAMTERRIDMDSLKNKKKFDEGELQRLQQSFVEQQLKVRQGVISLEKKMNEESEMIWKMLSEIELQHYKKCVEAMEKLQCDI